MADIIRNRYDFVILFDVENGNPNGDPDAGNMPRIDPETGCGLVTDVCLKRKIRNYVEMAKEDTPGYGIYIKDGVPLNRSDAQALEACGLKDADPKTLKKADPDIDRKLRDAMCSRFYDIRTFGAVMTTFVKAALNCGQVRGPVQLGFARSVDPIVPQEVTITRVAITTEADAEKKGTEMGRKYIVPYGLYRAEGFVSANLARKSTGFNEDDLALLWEAILNMFEHDHSAARGKMAVRELIIFKHDSELGNAPAWKLFESVRITRRDGVQPARQYSDYIITVDDNLPEGGKLHSPGVTENGTVMLSALQHFVFCRRQWALIHLEQQWADNVRTVEGNLMHRRAHDEKQVEKRGDLLILRGLHVRSERLQATGICDVVEFHQHRRAYLCLDMRDCGSHIQWNISEAVPKRTTRMNCSCAPRLCVWRKCCCALSRRAVCTMVKTADELGSASPRK